MKSRGGSSGAIATTAQLWQRARDVIVGKAAVGVTDVSPLVGTGGWFSILREQNPGDWQRGIKPEGPETLLQFGAAYGAVSLIANDIGKLPLRLQRFDEGVWKVTQNPAYSPVLRKPNRYQTKSQFLVAWMVSKLMWGNTFVLKERDERGVVRALYVLEPSMVRVIVTDDGGVYYHLALDRLGNTEGPITVPASEIIHDRCISPFHPLIGISPLYAAALTVAQGRRIQTNSSVFFENMSRPSGQLTSDHEISDETAERLKRDFEEKFAGRNIGKVLVAGSGLKYEAMTMPAEQAQLIEQLGWTGEDCVRPFLIPAYKLGLGKPPTFNNIGQLAQDYYTTCLQQHMEGIEELLTEGLGLASDLKADLDEMALLRMDQLARIEYIQKGMQAGLLSPDEGRQMENLSPLPEGAGKVPYLQHQQYPITMLAKRKDLDSPAATPAQPATAPAATPAPAPTPAPADPVKSHEEAQRMAADFFDTIVRGLDVESA